MNFYFPYPIKEFKITTDEGVVLLIVRKPRLPLTYLQERVVGPVDLLAIIENIRKRYV